MNLRSSISIFMFALSLAGCATLDESQCQTVDWRTLGARDAYDGHERSRIEAHQSACRPSGIQPDREAYQLGFDDGLRGLCTGSRGYQFGVDGRSYRNTCPVELDAVFQSGFRLGGEERREAVRINTLQNDLRSAEERLRKSQDVSERARLRRQIQTLDESLRDAQRRRERLREQALQLGYR